MIYPYFREVQPGIFQGFNCFDCTTFGKPRKGTDGIARPAKPRFQTTGASA